MALGHQVKLISPQFVRPFVKTNKTDAADAQAIWEAAQRPGMRFVALKTVTQQAILTLHRMREQLVKMRTMQINQLRGLLYEFGADLPRGRQRAIKLLPEELIKLEGVLPATVLEPLRAQLQRLGGLDRDIAEIERKLQAWVKTDDTSHRVMEIPGVGLLTATAATAMVGDPRVFKSGRQFAAYVGLVPRQSGTGGRVTLLGISKRGDSYLRTLLIHGARAVIHSGKPDPWLEKLLARRPFHTAVVALANKNARTIWALMAHGTVYQERYSRP
jgi:transposase